MALLSKEEIAHAKSLADRIVDGLNKRIFGQEQLIRMIVVACLSKGHVLLEGLPGLGKTELVKGLAGLLGLNFKRIQFTPDLLPSDITGAPILEEEQGKRRMVFKQGPIFGNLILADEINRASPRTQAAMLEAMQEQSVTVLGTTHMLPDPFWTMATQNPIDLEGTYPLPEAQLDRFLFKLLVYRVDADVMSRIISKRRRGIAPRSTTCLTQSELQNLYHTVGAIFLPEAVSEFIGRLVESTHPDSTWACPEVKGFVRYGASPRAAIGMAEAGRAHALLEGKPNVGFSDIIAVAPHILGHRIALDYKARLEGWDAQKITEKVIESMPQLDMPA
ncbi:MAG: AAA family ATPase [Myxococcota bacterium]|nr:AAA family ATPase [Myxococcota bacterium]